MDNLCNDFVICDPPGTKKKTSLCSNNTRAGDFLLVHESPISKRRELRASKELNDRERAALAPLVNLCLAEDTSSTMEASIADEDDEVGAFVVPSPRPSFKNGRRVSDPSPAARVSFGAPQGLSLIHI